MTTSREEKIAAFRRLNDPAGNLYWIARARRLHPDRLAASNAIDVPISRRLPARPSLAECLALALAVIVIVAALVAVP